MLISRKMTKDKIVVTDFRHLNMCIAKNNLAYQLLKDTFSMLGSSKCEVMSVLDLKDAFHSLQLTENSKKFCGILPYFGSPSYLYQRMSMGLNILFGVRNNKRPLMRSNIGYKDPQSYIYQTDMDDSSYIQTPASLLLVVHCTKFRTGSQGSLPMLVRECQRQPRTIQLQS